jgi:adenosylcobinamide-GDP ribazoletransferase
MAFLTRLPTPTLAGFEEIWLADALLYFPPVGVIVGLIAAAAYRLASLVWPSPVAALAAVAAAATVTGGLHEDGWADLFDALAASRDRERMLAVMKDSRIGASGALALVLLVAGRVAVLAALPAAEVPAALIAAHALSRWTTLPLAWRLPYVRPAGGLGKPLAGRVTGRRVAAGTALAALIAAITLGWSALPALTAAAVVAFASGLFFRARLGGVTGDCLGAAIQLAELAILLALAARWPAPS